MNKLEELKEILKKADDVCDKARDAYNDWLKKKKMNKFEELKKIELKARKLLEATDECKAWDQVADICRATGECKGLNNVADICQATNEWKAFRKAHDARLGAEEYR